MKLSTSTLATAAGAFLAALIAMAMATPTDAFSSVALIGPQRRHYTASALQLSSSSDTDIEALRATAAKARQDAERLRQELGMLSPSTQAAAATLTKKKSSSKLQAMIPTVLATNDWSALAEASSNFGSANLKTFQVSLKMLEQRTGLGAAAFGLTDSGEEDVNLDDFKYATLYVLGFSCVSGVAALAWLPPNVGATVCYAVALLPILFLGIGSSAPGIIAGAIQQVKEATASGDDGNAPVSAIDRACRHEAAHFCCGYWCGLPIASYDVASSETAQVEFAVDAKDSRYTSNTVAALAVTGLAGLVGEALEYGNAKGATQDLMVLDQVFRQAQDFYGAQQQQDLTRWAALTASLLLRNNKEKYEQVYEAFTRKAALEECVGILEA